MACSIIVPVDLARRPLGLLRRLEGLLRGPAPQDTRELVLVHADRGSRWDRMLERMSR